MAMNQQQLDAAVERSNRISRSTDLPLFYGAKDKDTVEASFLIDRVETAAGVANWNTDDLKIGQFRLSLRDKALIWWKSLADANVNTAVWDEVKAAFIKAYQPRYSARTNCTNFQDLVQISSESVLDYYLRVYDTFTKVTKGKPATITAEVNWGPPDVLTAAVAALPAAQRNLLLEIKREGVKQLELFVMHQLFLAGLKDEVRIRAMEANKPTVQEALDYARDLEVILADKKKAAHVNLVQGEAAKLDEEEIQLVEAIRQQRGKPYTRNPNQGTYKRTPASDLTCHYCGIRGHVIRECRKRMSQEMGQNGQKPYRRVQSIKDDRNVRISTLNW